MPSELQVLALEDCLEALIDYRGKTPRKTDSGIPLITAKVVKGGRIETPTEFIAPEDFDSWMTRGLPKVGDVVMTTEAPLGEVGQILSLPVALAQRIVTLRGKPHLLENDYLLYLLQAEAFQEQLKGRSSGTTVVGIKQSELRKVRLSLPPVQLQREVASILKALDQRIDLLRQTNATLESIAQALFKSWFTDFDPVRAKAEGREPEGMDAATAALFPAEFEESALGLIPQGWVAGSVAELAALNAASWTARRAPQEVLYVDLTGVKANVFEPPQRLLFADAPSRARRELRSGDTLVGTVRPGNRSFGFIADAEPGLTGSTGFAVLSPLVPNAAAFVYLCATRDENIERLAALADGGAYPAVRPELVQTTACVLPSVGVMNAFHEVAFPLLRGVAENARRTRLLAEVRDALLPRLISGKLRLPEAQEAVEAVAA